jgi:hypothetical protein
VRNRQASERDPHQILRFLCIDSIDDYVIDSNGRSPVAPAKARTFAHRHARAGTLEPLAQLRTKRIRAAHMARQIGADSDRHFRLRLEMEKDKNSRLRGCDAVELACEWKAGSNWTAADS